MEVANSRTAYLDEVHFVFYGHVTASLTSHPQDRQVEVDHHKILFGGKLGSGPADMGDEDEEMSISATRTVKPGQRVN